MTNAIIVDPSFANHFKTTLELAADEPIDVSALRESLLLCALALTPQDNPAAGSTERYRRPGREIRRVDCARSPYTLGSQIKR